MKTKMGLISLVSLAAASLAFSGYGVAMAAPSFHIGGFLQGLSVDHSTRPADVAEMSAVGETRKAAEMHNLEATGSTESSERPAANETESQDGVSHDSRLTQASDINGGGSQVDGGHDRSRQSSGDGGQDGSGQSSGGGG